MACGGLGAAAPILAFSLEDAPQLAAGFFTDFLGSLPTSRKVYSDPHSENGLAWVLFSIGTILNLFAIEHWVFAEAVYPVRMVFIMGSITVLVLRPFWSKGLRFHSAKTR